MSEAGGAPRTLVVPLLALTLGHMLSNAVRTMPALAADVLARDLGLTGDGLAALGAAYLFAFAAGVVPLGVALDRWGVRPVSITLFLLVGAGALAAAAAGGWWGFLLAQVLLGLGCCGMLLCPMTYAAQRLTPAGFGLWSGLIQGIGNMGMLLSASPLAWLVEAAGWRAGYLASVGFGAVGLALVALTVRGPVPAREAGRTLLGDVRATLGLFVGRALRPVLVLGFASFAVMIGVRGLWGGPWLMEAKGFSRIEAGHGMFAMTLALIAGPLLAGVVDRALGHRAAVLAAGHFLAGAALLVMVGVGALPGWVDVGLMVGFALTLSVQPLCFAMARAAVAPALAGRAMAALNLSFFGGAALLQAGSGVAAGFGGIGAGIGFLAAAALLGTAGFWVLVRGRAAAG